MRSDRPVPRICCLDLDTFFVSVERLHRPELIGQPVVIGALPGSRGVVTAASYEVRKFGVRSGMPISEAYRRAPHATYLRGRPGEYSEYAANVKQILERYAPVVRTASIDEFFLDFQGCESLYRQPSDPNDDAAIERVVREMRQTIQDQLGLPASAGLAVSRPIAKMASGLAKPAGVMLVKAGREYAFVAPLPVRRWPGIGPVAEQQLANQGIRTLGELLAQTQHRTDGIVQAVRQAVNQTSSKPLGRDRPAFREHDSADLTQGSISNESTFARDVGDPQAIRNQLTALCERVCWRLRKRGVLAKTITLKLRYTNFETLTRSRTIDPTDNESRILDCASRLFHTTYESTRSVRLLGIGLSHLVTGQRQLLFPFLGEPQPSVGKAIDAVRERFGYQAIHLGMKKMGQKAAHRRRSEDA